MLFKWEMPRNSYSSVTAVSGVGSSPLTEPRSADAQSDAAQTGSPWANHHQVQREGLRFQGLARRGPPCGRREEACNPLPVSARTAAELRLSGTMCAGHVPPEQKCSAGIKKGL